MLGGDEPPDQWNIDVDIGFHGQLEVDGLAGIEGEELAAS
jgi:hypothetical protein